MELNSSILELLFQHISSAVVFCDKDNKIVKVNPAFIHAFEYPEHEIIGKILLNMEGIEDNQALFETILIQSKDKDHLIVRIRFRAKMGGVSLSTATILILRDSAGKVLRFITIIDELPQLGKDSKKNKEQFDQLTGLPNLSLLNDRVSQTMIAAKRENKSVALITIGMDGFTRINEGLGFTFGDMTLQEVAQRLKGIIRQSDTVGRKSGDNFCLVMAISDIVHSIMLAKKLMKAIETPFFIKGQEIFITCSIGISIYPKDGDNPSELLKLSEMAMFHAKKRGGNGYQFFSNDMNTKARHRIELEKNLRRAIENNEFMVYYQPKVQIETNRIVGAEALLRWQDPKKGIISPADFIPIAEESGLIIPIGFWVLNDVCETVSKWQKKYNKSVRVSVNITSLQFKSVEFIDQLMRILKETGISPKLIELEITESMLMSQTDTVIEKLKIIKELGIHISIDDFGTGYSSLSYLSKFPINTLKIDRAFIKDVSENPFNAEITRAIIALSNSLKLEVVAEGAELVEQIEFLQANGCSTVQGFYYSKPLPQNDFEAALKIGYLKSH